MNPKRMTIEELRTLELPVTLTCDDGCFNYDCEEITIQYVGNTRFFVKNTQGKEFALFFDELKHYPSIKEDKVEHFYHWMTVDGFVSNTLHDDNGLKPNGSLGLSVDNKIRLEHTKMTRVNGKWMQQGEYDAE